MKALKNKGTPAWEGEQTQEKQLKMNDQQRKQEKPKKKPKKKAKQDEDEVKDE